MLIQNPIIKQVLGKYELMRAIQHLLALSEWEMLTYMPSDAVQLRGQTHSKLTIHLQQLMLDKEFIVLVRSLDHENLNDTEKGIRRVLKANIDEYIKLPEEFIKERTEVTNEANGAREQAREKSDFSLYEPHLTKIVDLCIQKAELLGYTDHPYDALMDSYEAGLTTKEVETYFSEIKGPLLDILAKVKKQFLSRNGIELLTYDKDSLTSFNQTILKELGFDSNRIRLDLSAHPFCQGLTNSDARITMRYEKDFNNTLFGSMHEYGHALYELGYHDELNKTPIKGGQSLIIHESQSRFWENIVGRSEAFTGKFIDGYKSLGKGYDRFTIEDFYNHINHVEPGYIRVDADELTYHFHILIRFEIEKALMEKKVTVKDLPAYRNKMYKDYLGIDIPNDAMGLLQDVHRSFGGIGYFPTYSMGTALSVIRKEAMEKDLGSIETLIQQKDGIVKMREWLKEHIHQYGATYTLNELLAKHNLTFSPAPLLNYLEKKFCS